MADETKGLTRKQQAEYTRRMLFKKGCQILKHADSPDDFVVEEITEACGVSKGTFYLYFKSKGAFFYNVKQTLAEEANNELISLLEDTSQSAQGTILEFVRLWTQRIRNFKIPLNDGLLAAVRDAYSPDGAPRSFSPKRLEQMFQIQIAAGIERGEFVAKTPAERLAPLIVITLTGFAGYFYVHGENLDYSEWANEAVNLVDSGILRPWLAKRRGRRKR